MLKMNACYACSYYSSTVTFGPMTWQWQIHYTQALSELVTQ